MVDLSEFEDGMIFSPLQKKLMELLEGQGPMTRQELVSITGKPRTTIYDNLMRLQKHQLVKKFPRPRNTRGRPSIFFKIVENV